MSKINQLQILFEKNKTTQLGSNGGDGTLKLGKEASKLLPDASPLVRMELVFVLGNLIYYQQLSFRETFKTAKQQSKHKNIIVIKIYINWIDR